MGGFLRCRHRPASARVYLVQRRHRNERTVRNLSWFSRYDRKTINRLKEVYAFLNNPASGFLGYTDAEKFIVDLGLYFENPPAVYVSRIKRNLGLLLERVNSIEAKYGDAAYL